MINCIKRSSAADISNSVRAVTLPLSMLHYYIIVNFEKGCFGGMKTFISRLYMIRQQLFFYKKNLHLGVWLQSSPVFLTEDDNS